MKSSEYLRRIAFSWFDRIKGGHIQNNYEDISFILNNYDQEVIKQLRNQYLSEVLSHAIKTTPFYKSIKNPELKNFPVINKNIIRNNFNSFNSNDIRYRPYVSVVTSGSTGTPFTIYHDKRKRERNTADTILFSKYAGFRLGQRLYYFKIWNEINKKNRLSSVSQNVVSYDVRSLSDESIKRIIDTLINDPVEKGLLAYSSVYEEICHFLQKSASGPVQINPTSIIAMSEAFPAYTKKMMLYYFGINPVSRYSNVENGIIAQQMPDGSDEFLINEASYYVEMLDIEVDIPVQIGNPGRIVITDLFNYCVPLIRYDTGDIGIITEKKILGCLRPVFKSIEGRRMDMIYNTVGSLVSSFVITNNMWKYRDVKQYQFIQESAKNYIFILNTELPFNRSEQLIEEFKVYFGKDANIRIEYVNEIPLLASGKRKKVVNISAKS